MPIAMRFHLTSLSTVSVALFAGCAPDPAAPASAAAPPRVTVAALEERELLDQDEFNGWLAAPETVDVRARVRGHIMKIHFTDGQIVKKDELLFTLDKRPFEAEVQRVADETRVLVAQQVAADREHARLRELLGKGGASQSQVDKAEADAKALEAGIQASRQEEVRRKLDVEFCDITAPIGGRISRAQLTEGNLVNAGGSDPLLTTIVAVDPIYVYFDVTERALQRYIKKRPEGAPEGDKKTLRDLKLPFTFGLEGEVGYPHEGTLNFAENRIDRTTGTIQVRGEASNSEDRLVPGSRARIRVPVDKPYKALVVPDTAILTDQDRKYLLVVGENNVVIRKDVELGKRLDDGARVVRPAAQGTAIAREDRVIVLGLQRARLNYPVEPMDAAGKPLTAPGAAPPASAPTAPAPTAGKS
jgi:RND family efflux transporter MFP subunit